MELKSVIAVQCAFRRQIPRRDASTSKIIRRTVSEWRGTGCVKSDNGGQSEHPRNTVFKLQRPQIESPKLMCVTRENQQGAFLMKLECLKAG